MHAAVCQCLCVSVYPFVLVVKAAFLWSSELTLVGIAETTGVRTHLVGEDRVPTARFRFNQQH